MLITMNVTIGALLSVVLALSPVFTEIHQPRDLMKPLIFVLSILFMTGNIHGTTSSFYRRQYAFMFASILMFVVIEFSFIGYYTLSLPPLGDDNYLFQLVFYKVEYVWVFIILTILWFFSSLFAAWCDRDWLR